MSAARPGLALAPVFLAAAPGFLAAALLTRRRQMSMRAAWAVDDIGLEGLVFESKTDAELARAACGADESAPLRLVAVVPRGGLDAAREAAGARRQDGKEARP